CYAREQYRGDRAASERHDHAHIEWIGTDLGSDREYRTDANHHQLAGYVRALQRCCVCRPSHYCRFERNERRDGGSIRGTKRKPVDPDDEPASDTDGIRTAGYAVIDDCISDKYDING